MLTFPPMLTKGDRVRIVAPSGAFDRQRFVEGLQILAGLGLDAVYDEGLFATHRYLAGDDDHRHQQLLDALHDNQAQCVWAARGGYGAARLLGRLRPADITQAPKWFVGFSDATALHGLYGRAGLASVHGANITTLPTWSERAQGELWHMLSDARHRSTYEGKVLLGTGVASGVILGGNLTVLASLAGTGHLPSFAGCIVLLEDVGERPYRLDRVLCQLLLSQAFNGVRGIAVGQLTHCEAGASDGYTVLDVMRECLQPLNVPVVYDLPVGHEPSSRAMVLGALAELDADNARLRVASSQVNPRR